MTGGRPCPDKESLQRIIASEIASEIGCGPDEPAPAVSARIAAELVAGAFDQGWDAGVDASAPRNVVSLVSRLVDAVRFHASGGETNIPGMNDEEAVRVLAEALRLLKRHRAAARIEEPLPSGKDGQMPSP